MKRLLILLFILLPVCALADYSTPAAVSTSYSSDNDHYVRGGSRVVAINGTVICTVVDGASERLFRSVDRINWTEIDYNASVYSSALVTGKDNYVYYFFRSGTTIRMVKFLYNAESIPSPVTIHSDANLANSSTGVYRSVNATVDSTGRLFVFTHYGTGDSVYCLVSEAGGDSWNEYIVAAPSGSESALYGMEATVLSDDTVCITWDGWSTSPCYFSKSTDHGVNWTAAATISSDMANPSIIADRNDYLYIFGQTSGTLDGVIFVKSINKGNDWSAESRVEVTTGYGDPEAAIASNGDIYVLFRSTTGVGDCVGDCASVGDFYRQKMAYTTEASGGASWTSAWSYPNPALRVGVKGHLRYQPFFNYGGQIDLLWLQYTSENPDVRRTYFVTNPDITLYQRDADTIPTIQSCTIINGSIR